MCHVDLIVNVHLVVPVEIPDEDVWWEDAPAGTGSRFADAFAQALCDEPTLSGFEITGETQRDDAWIDYQLTYTGDLYQDRINGAIEDWVHAYRDPTIDKLRADFAIIVAN